MDLTKEQEKILQKRKANWAIIQEVTDHVQLETVDSYDKFRDFNSYHEGYAVIKEEVDELWDEIKTKEKDFQAIEEEAIQVAAMAMKLLVFMRKRGNTTTKYLNKNED